MESSENSQQNQVKSHEVQNDVLANHTGTDTDEDDSFEEENNMFSSRSISVTASSIGISSLSDDVCRQIAAELYYKTKELIHMSKLILLQNKRSTLTTNDVKSAMKLLGGVEIYGHDSKDEVNFIHIPKADVYIPENPEMDIVQDALSDSSYVQKGEPFIRGSWIMPEGYSEDPAIVTPCTYYQQLAKTIMTGGPAHIKVALNDLRTNPKIGSVCPYFLNFVSLTVQKVPRDIHLTNALIGTVHAIAHNKYVDPSPFRAVNRAVKALLKIVTEVNIDKTDEDGIDKDDDLTVRIRAGLLLAKVVILWSIELKQQIDIVKLLLQRLLDPKAPLQSHYGAIVALTALGQRALDFRFWLVMERYVPQLVSKIGSTKGNIMIQHIVSAILVAARSAYKKEQISNPEQLKQLFKVDQMLYSSFGDSVTPLRMVASPPLVHTLRSTVPQSRLKLKLCRTKRPIALPRCEPTDLCSVFDVPPRLSRFTNNIYNEHLDIKKHAYLCVQRNLKFCQPRHQTSASGDLHLML